VSTNPVDVLIEPDGLRRVARRIPEAVQREREGEPPFTWMSMGFAPNSEFTIWALTDDDVAGWEPLETGDVTYRRGGSPPPRRD
jgi:hypothetical protein